MEVNLKVFEINEPIETFMNTEQFEKEFNEPARQYYDQVYKTCIEDLTYRQKEVFDDWWFNKKSIPSDECFWKKTSVPEGYEHLSPEDIKCVHDSILTACSLGCG